MSPGTTMWANNTLYGFDWSLATPLVVHAQLVRHDDVLRRGNGSSDYTYEAIYNQMVAEEGTLRAERVRVWSAWW